jgi:hypothetical protein
MKKKTQDILIATSAGVLGIGVAAIIALLLIVPLLKNTCTWFDGRCASISYQRLPNGQLLVKDPVLGLSYWYDGNFIRSYGVHLPGKCPSSVPVDADDIDVAIGEGRVMCDHFAPDGVTCLAQSGTPTIPTQLDGIPQPSQTGISTLEPAFIMNAHTLTTSQQGVLCSRARNVVETSFQDVPLHTVKTHIPRDTDGRMDVAQMFSVLQTKGVFSPPEKDPEPPICNGHGVVDPLTSLCVCEVGYTGALCGTQMCASDQSCGGKGVCNGGLCECDPGWGGDSCEQQTCSPECVNGECDPNTGQCVCREGFEGEACEHRSCVQPCVNGTCDTVNGLCKCDEGWGGVACEVRTCPGGCSGNGFCLESGECDCDPVWKGDACDEPVCENNCSFNGTCNEVLGTCDCDPGWTGDDCGTSTCERGCCAHGTCDPETSTCACIPGWGGADCSVPDDPLTTVPMCPYEMPL